MNIWVVLWSYAENRLLVAQLEDAINDAAGAFLSDRPPYAIVRASLTREQADRYVRANLGMLDERRKVRENCWDQRNGTVELRLADGGKIKLPWSGAQG